MDGSVFHDHPRTGTHLHRAVPQADKKDATIAEQARRTEVATIYLQELENIVLKRNVAQVKVPSGITLTEHEAQYLTKFSNRMYVCFLCRVCKWYGRNDHWATSLSGGAFRCCNCGVRYRAVENNKGLAQSHCCSDFGSMSVSHLN